MKKPIAFFLAAFLSMGLFAQTTWKSDKNHSQISFAVTHSGISEVEGVFDRFDATMVSSEKDFSDAEVEVTIETASIDTHVDMRDDHLRSEDFFNTEKYPTMTFKSTNIEKTSKNHYKLTGDLTMHGITKPVVLDMWYRGTIEGKKGKVAGFQFTGELDRTAFNIGTGFPDAALSNEIQIKVDAEFKKQ